MNRKILSLSAALTAFVLAAPAMAGSDEMCRMTGLSLQIAQSGQGQARQSQKPDADKPDAAAAQGGAQQTQGQIDMEKKRVRKLETGDTKKKGQIKDSELKNANKSQ